LALKLLINSLQNFHGLILRSQIFSPGNFGTSLKIEEKIRRKGALGVLFGRHILGLRTQIFLMARVMRMSVTKFLIADPHTAILALTVALFWAGIVFLKN